MSAVDTQVGILEDLEIWYKKERPLYRSLSETVSSLIKGILEKNEVEYHSITFRAKDVESLITKAKNKNYKNPKEEIQDFAGIRIITFVKSDVIKACNLIKPEFIIDEENSSDKTEELGDDKVGYRSVHYIAKLSDARVVLSEYSHFKDMYFEIQVRTILEHAWADISHDRTYKFNNSLPEKNDIKRRFSLAAASLEMVDREFDRLSNEIEEYSKVIASEAEKGNLVHEINGTSLMAYMKSKFSIPINNNVLEPTFVKNEKVVISELSSMGINSLTELDDIIDEISFKNSISLEELCENSTNFIGLLRNIMILHDARKYFRESWKGDWSSISKKDCDFYKKFGVDYMDIAINIGLINVEDFE